MYVNQCFVYFDPSDMFYIRTHAQTAYSRPVDMWAVGCIMAEIIDGQPLFPGASDVDQLDIIQRLIGPITEKQMRTLTKNGRKPRTKPRTGKSHSFTVLRYL